MKLNLFDRKQLNNSEGFTVVEIVVVLIVIGFLAGAAYYVWAARNVKSSDNATVEAPKGKMADVNWSWDGQKWAPSSAPPECPKDLKLTPPADIINQATHFLPPGQVRGGDFKAHGGFRFDNNKTNSLDVKLALDSTPMMASRYIEMGEVQYFVDFINPCGLVLRYDHLAQLSPELQKIIDPQLPEPKVDDSRGTNLKNMSKMKAGEPVAVKVGYAKKLNVGFDFGVMDLRKPNEASKKPSFPNQDKNDSYAAYGFCWMDLFDSATAAKIKSLPGPGTEGKTSAYCSL